jgi:hypothetical protein
MAKWQVYGQGCEGTVVSATTLAELKKVVSKTIEEQIYSCRNEGVVAGQKQYRCEVGRPAWGGGFHIKGRIVVRRAKK